MANFAINIPSNVSFKAWDKGKKKGTPSTGLGDKLKAYDKALGKFDYRSLTVMGQARGVEEIQAAMPKANAAAKAVPGFIKVCQAVIDHIDKQIPIAKKKKDFPAESLTIMNDIKKALIVLVSDLQKGLPQAMNTAVNSLKDYDKRIVEIVKEITRMTIGTEKYSDQAEAIAGMAAKYLKVVQEAEKKKNAKVATKAAIEVEKLTKKIETLWKTSEELSKDWRVNSAKYSNFMSQSDKVKHVIPLSKRLMNANANIKKQVNDTRDTNVKARDVANQANLVKSGYNV